MFVMQAVAHVLDQAVINAQVAKKDYCKLLLTEFVNAIVQFIVNYQEDPAFALQVITLLFIYCKGYGKINNEC